MTALCIIVAIVGLGVLVLLRGACEALSDLADALWAIANPMPKPTARAGNDKCEAATRKEEKP